MTIGRKLLPHIMVPRNSDELLIPANLLGLAR